MAPYDRDAIRQLRDSLSMSQREFASHLKVPQTTVNRWETGRTTPNGEYLGMMFDLAQRHSQSFTPFAASTPRADRKDIAVEASREWLRRSKGPRGKDREDWLETFVQMLGVVSRAQPGLQQALTKAEALASCEAPEGEVRDLLKEVQADLGDEETA